MDYDVYVKEPLPFLNDLLSFYSQGDKLTVFEIGSCEGEDTIRIKKAFPNSIVYTFEALPKNVKIIQRNLKRFGMPTNKIFNLALSNHDGKSEFYVSSGHPDHLPRVKGWNYGNKSSSLLPPKEHKKVLEWVKFKERIEVKTSRLDSFCKKYGINKIDFIYIDVQGAELMVLEGAGNILKNVGAIWMEVEAIELYEGQPLKPEVEKFMRNNGFIRIHDTVDQISGDQLYIKKDLASRQRFMTKIKSIMSKIQ